MVRVTELPILKKTDDAEFVVRSDGGTHRKRFYDIEKSIMDKLGFYGRALEKCKYCGQYGAVMHPCGQCGAPIDPREG